MKYEWEDQTCMQNFDQDIKGRGHMEDVGVNEGIKLKL
jgi:hypothetical protein